MPNSEDKKLNFVAKVFDPVTQTYRPLYIAPDGTDTVQGDVFLSDDADETKTAANGMTAVTPAGLYKAINEYNPFKHQTVGSETVPIYMKDGQPEEITGLDANSIISGTISMDRLPQGAMERLVPVPDQAARFVLTTKEVQLGDVVQQLDTQVMYVVIDESNLSNEKGYTQFSAGLATQLGTTTVGDTQTPIYLNEGKPEVVNKVKAALVADKLTTVDITNGTDLNTLTDSNKYYSCQTNVTAHSLVNCPVTSAFTMRTEYINTNYQAYIQVLTSYTGQMWYRSHSENGFTEWWQIYPANTTVATGVLPVSHGGTGKTTLQEVANELWLTAPATEGELVDTNYLWCGDGSASAPNRKTLTQLWEWAQPKVKVTKVDNATYSDKADSANSATSAAEAGHANKADTATNADNAKVADTLKGLAVSPDPKWGIQEGTVNLSFSDDNAGGLLIRKDCPSAGQLSIVIDGNVYVQDGKKRVIYEGEKVASAVNADTATNATKATVADKLGTSTVGSANQGIWLDDGVPKATTGGSLDEKAVFLAAHPVGTYWWTSSTINPNTEYGGTWERVKDKFVWAMGDSDTVGSTGGAKTVILTTAQMPSHTHSGPSHSHTLGSHTHSIPSHSHSLNSHTHSTPDHTHTWANANNKAWSGNQTLNSSRPAIASSQKSGEPGYQSATNGYYAGWIKTTAWMVSSGGGTTGAATGSTASGGSGTTDSASGSTGSGGTGDTGSAGSGNAHENMPPYVAAYCWHRTA